MRRILLIVSALFCGGCQAREPQLFRVVDAADLSPVEGANVWMQPWAPIHPFWPAGDRGVTDSNGEVTLRLPGPEHFWFYLSSVKAKGYTKVERPAVKNPDQLRDLWQNTLWKNTRLVFFVRRDPVADAR